MKMRNRSIVYLAGAYSANPVLSFELHKYIVAQVLKAEDPPLIYSPIAYGHTVGAHAPYMYWIEHGLRMLDACECVWVVQHPQLPALASKGVQMELQRAAERDLPVCSVDVKPDHLDLAMFFPGEHQMRSKIDLVIS